MAFFERFLARKRKRGAGTGRSSSSSRNCRSAELRETTLPETHTGSLPEKAREWMTLNAAQDIGALRPRVPKAAKPER